SRRGSRNSFRRGLRRHRGARPAERGRFLRSLGHEVASGLLYGDRSGGSGALVLESRDEEAPDSSAAQGPTLGASQFLRNGTERHRPLLLQGLEHEMSAKTQAMPDLT